MTNIYTAHATASGGRQGRAVTDDGVLDVVLTTPKEMGGDGARGTNPEQLFAAGYSACLLGAIKAAARKSKIAIREDSSITAAVSFRDRPNGEEGFWIEVAMDISLPGLDKETAEKAVADGHALCPYSEVSRKGFNVTLNVQ